MAVEAGAAEQASHGFHHKLRQALLQPFASTNVFEYDTVDANGNPVTRRAYATAIAYIDGIAVCTFGTIMDHEVFLRRILARMQHSNLRLQPKKYDFFSSPCGLSGAYLERRRHSTAGTESACDSKLASFNGSHFYPCFHMMCSYYRRFVKDFAKIAQPLTDLL